MVGLQRMRWTQRRKGQIAEYLAKNTVRKLQIGAGFHAFEGWLNTDLEPRGPQFVYMDATTPYPLPTDSFDYIFTEHIIEHVPYTAGKAMLGECLRVLKPGGRIRIATPDLQNLLGLYSPDKTEMQQRYMAWITQQFLPNVPKVHECYVLNNAFRNWGHQFLYDRETLADLLTRVGFDQIKWCESNISNDPVLSGIDTHGSCIEDQDMNRFESMIVEAVKPHP